MTPKIPKDEPPEPPATAPASPDAFARQLPSHDPEDPAPAVIPHGYEVRGDGVFAVGGRRDDVRIAARPIYYSGSCINPVTKEQFDRLTYQGLDRKYRFCWVSREDIISREGITKLGLPVDPLTARAMVRYLASGYWSNGTRPTITFGHRSGLHKIGGMESFLLGNTWVGPPGTKLMADPRPTPFSGAFDASGDWEAWLAAFRGLYELPTPAARCVVAAAFLPPLMGDLHLRNFVFHLWGHPDDGGRALMRFAVSASLDPGVFAACCTEDSVLETFEHVSDLPVMFDRSCLPRHALAPAQFISLVCDRQAHERLSSDGRSRHVGTWRTVALSTGETPLVQPNDLGGQARRVLELHTSFIEIPDPDALDLLASTHHGLAGRRFLRALVDAQPYGPRPFFDFFLGKFAARVGVRTDCVKYAAALATAELLSAHWLLGVPLERAAERALESGLWLLKSSGAIERPTLAMKALLLLRDDWASRPGNYADARTTPDPTDRRQS